MIARSKVARGFLGTAPPLLALAAQHMMWQAVHHFTCLLFYPAVFLSSWLGGVVSGLLATSLSVVLVWFFFVPPEGNTDPAHLVSLAVFIGMGVLFTAFHERLRNANQRAAAAWEHVNQLREEWASIVAHDLQQPINAIALRADLLLRATMDETQRGDAVEIRGAAKRLSRMVRDLSDASQLEASRMVLVREPLDMCALVRDVVKRDPGTAARVRVRAPSERWIDGDAGRIEQVLLNLLSNAMKYGDPDAPIEVVVDGLKSRVRISITNRGPGIDPADIPVLFRRYARTRQARTSAAKGSGLGLYIAKGLVEAQGGRLSVESLPGETTTFRITLPLTEPPGRAAEALAL
jgi:signal transduction histidine kinase